MNGRGKIDLLLVDHDSDFRGSVARRFLRRGYQVQEVSSGAEGLTHCARRHFDVIILDMVMPGMSGLEALERIKAVHPECEVIMLTSQGTIEMAIQAMKLGAYDYLTKPFQLSELEQLIERAYERGRLCKENLQLQAVIARQRQAEPEMIGQSPAILEVFRLIERAGPTDKAILIQGESGTGKELVARALHRRSLRADKPLVVINCAALPEFLLECELFGHEKGAFTGAAAAKPGLFEIADGGTLFIGEIGELTSEIQAKMLRVLEDGLFRRIGSVKERHVNVRLLASTNRSIAEEVKEGRFREDLYYRINVISLELPPLRKRTGDIRLLVEQFLGLDWSLVPEALRALETYEWPGNIHQLFNAIDWAKTVANDHLIRLENLPAVVANGNDSENNRLQMAVAGDKLATIQRAHIVDILNRESGNKARAARALGVNRRTFYRLLDKHNIRPVKDGADKSTAQPPGTNRLS